MKAYDHIEAYQWLCKSKNKFGVYVNNGLEFISKDDTIIWNFVLEQMMKLFPDISAGELADVMINSSFFTFDSREEMEKFYIIFTQELTDSSAIYAMTINSDGELETENT